MASSPSPACKGVVHNSSLHIKVSFGKVLTSRGHVSVASICFSNILELDAGDNVWAETNICSRMTPDHSNHSHNGESAEGTKCFQRCFVQSRWPRCPAIICPAKHIQLTNRAGHRPAHLRSKCFKLCTPEDSLLFGPLENSALCWAIHTHYLGTTLHSWQRQRGLYAPRLVQSLEKSGSINQRMNSINTYTWLFHL